ncbi:Ras-like protein family member 12 [Schistosoma japonicum]|nr:Ras-like protein family member 12 [Schistosoma japonicum]
MQRLYAKSVANVNTINISIIGMNGSGKSAVVVKYLTRRFIVEYAPYLSDSYTKADSVDGHELTVNIQDTSDSDEIDLDDIIKWSQAIIILFSMTSRRSFYRAQELVEAIHIQPDLTNRKPKLSGTQSYKSSNAQQTNTPSSSLATSSISSGNANAINTQHTITQSGSLRRSALYTINTAKPPAIVLVANKSDLERFRLVQKAEAEEFAKFHGIPYYEITVTETYKEVQTIFHAAARLYLQSKGLKPRQVNGQTMSSGRGILQGGNPPSVLSSLAVSPSLLLQKKSSTVSPSLEVTTSTESESNMTSSAGPTSILSNLKLRATSPTSVTSATKPPTSNKFTTGIQSTLNSKLPPTSSNQANQLSSPQPQQTTTNPSTTQSTSTIQALNTLSRKHPSVSSKSSQQSIEQQRIASSYISSTPNVNQILPSLTQIQSNKQSSNTTLPQPKKSGLGFKFFSKKK